MYKLRGFFFWLVPRIQTANKAPNNTSSNNNLLAGGGKDRRTREEMESVDISGVQIKVVPSETEQYDVMKGASRWDVQIHEHGR